jgi:hypothetical protein
MTKRRVTPFSREVYNWSKWRRMYISGEDNMTLAVMSALEGAPSLTTLEHRSTAEGWVSERAGFRQVVDAKLLEVRRDTKVEIKQRHTEIGEVLIGVAMQGIRALPTTTLEDGSVVVKLAPHNIAAFMQAGVMMQRDALGLNQEITLNIKDPRELKRLSSDELVKQARATAEQLAEIRARRLAQA